MSTPQELVACVERLASLPAVYHRIRALLDDPDSSVQDLADAVSSDAGITARVLRAVNSVLYGFPGKVETIGRAVNLMGMQQVHDLVLSTSVIGAFSGIRPARMHMIKFWKDCVFRGLAARAAARTLGTGDPERMFVEGLLADIGHLVLFQTAPELAAEARTLAGQGGEPLRHVARRIVGCDFAEVGATLMDQWRVPRAFAEAIGAQTLPRLGGEHAADAAALNLASHIVAADRIGESSEQVGARID